jgi:uncharacterized protein (DUF1015 family)
VTRWAGSGTPAPHPAPEDTLVDAAPFRALRYDARVAGDPTTTSAPSYDEVEPHTYARHRTASPYTVLELLTGAAGDHAQASAALERWRRTGVLVEDPDPAFYVYEEHELRHGVPAVQRGILAAVALEPLDGSGAVVAHEDVDPSRVRDRVERLRAVPVEVAPVFALYRGRDAALRDLLERPPRTPPVVAASDRDGTDHRVWALTDPEDAEVIRAGLADARAVIADGHHRYAAALDLARSGEGADGPARTLMYLVDLVEHGPVVQPIHRLLDAAGPLEVLDDLFTRLPGPDEPGALAAVVAAAGSGVIGVLHDRGAQLLQPRAPERVRALLPSGRSSTWQRLEAAVADHLIAPLLGARRTRHRTDVHRAAAEVLDAPDRVLLVLPPVPPGVVLDLAATGERMPPKTTSFHPKPRTGLVLRAVAGAEQRLPGPSGPAH